MAWLRRVQTEARAAPIITSLCPQSWKISNFSGSDVSQTIITAFPTQFRWRASWKMSCHRVYCIHKQTNTQTANSDYWSLIFQVHAKFIFARYSESGLIFALHRWESSFMTIIIAALIICLHHGHEPIIWRKYGAASRPCPCPRLIKSQ